MIFEHVFKLNRSEEVVVQEEVTEVTEANGIAAPEDLPLELAGDYQGIGGPDAVPLESDGAFEQPEKLPNAYNFLTDLFMAPSEDTIKSFQITEKKRMM